MAGDLGTTLHPSQSARELWASLTAVQSFGTHTHYSVGYLEAWEWGNYLPQSNSLAPDYYPQGLMSGQPNQLRPPTNTHHELKCRGLTLKKQKADALENRWAMMLSVSGWVMRLFPETIPTKSCKTNGSHDTQPHCGTERDYNVIRIRIHKPWNQGVIGKESIFPLI